MVKISSDNLGIENNIRQICSLLEQNGAYIDADIEIHDIKGQTCVWADSELSSKYIFKLPHELLVPYDNFDFDVEGQDIVIAHDDKNKSKEHLKILEDMLSLYNDAGKFQNHLKEHPLLRFNEGPELTNHLLKGREGQDIDIVKKIIKGPEFFDELALLVFFKSRLLHCCLNDKKARSTAVLIPVVEFMNHHNKGAGFDNLYHKEGSCMATEAAMPVAGSRECFTNYGRFDALDTYLHYGFVDQSATYVRSVPVQIDLGDIGKISVGAFNAIVSPEEVPEQVRDLAFYFPKMRIDHTFKKAELSHIFIPQDNARYSMRRILEFVIQLLEPKIDGATCLAGIGEAENQILESNMEYYNKLKPLVCNPAKDSTINCNLLLLNETQKEKIVHYKEIVNR